MKDKGVRTIDERVAHYLTGVIDSVSRTEITAERAEVIGGWIDRPVSSRTESVIQKAARVIDEGGADHLASSVYPVWLACTATAERAQVMDGVPGLPEEGTCCTSHQETHHHESKSFHL